MQARSPAYRLRFHTASVVWTCQTETYDRYVMRHYEVEYFKEAFLGTYLGFTKEFPGLESSFDHLIEEAGSAEKGFFLHRDFQSRNIMIMEGKTGILDWQGGRLGPLAYDVGSLLIDPYTHLAAQERQDLPHLPSDPQPKAWPLRCFPGKVLPLPGDPEKSPVSGGFLLSEQGSGKDLF